MSINRRLDPHVYFLRVVDAEGPVKIGCSQSPRDRLCSMTTWSPLPLELVAHTPGDEILERRFHALFRDQHSHGEWFFGSPELTRVMQTVADRTFDFTSLPAPMLTPRPAKPRWTPEQRLNCHMQNAARWIAAQGIEIPDDVNRALYRYSLNGSARHPVSRDRPDAEIIQAFLASHSQHLKDPRKLIEISRVAGFGDLYA